MSIFSRIFGKRESRVRATIRSRIADATGVRPRVRDPLYVCVFGSLEAFAVEFAESQPSAMPQLASDTCLFELGCYGLARVEDYLTRQGRASSDPLSKQLLDSLIDLFDGSFRIPRKQLAALVCQRLQFHGNLIKETPDSLRVHEQLAEIMMDASRAGKEGPVPTLGITSSSPASASSPLKEKLTSWEQKYLSRVWEALQLRASLDTPRKTFAYSEWIDRDIDSEGREIVYRVIGLPPEGQEMTLGSLPITVQVSTTVRADGKRAYGFDSGDGCDPFSVAEAGSAIYWDIQLRNGKIAPAQAEEWLKSLEKASGKRYLVYPDARRTLNDMTLFCALARASLDYFIAHFNDVAPVDAHEWFQAGMSQGPGFSRFEEVVKAQFFRELVKSGSLDDTFVTHLRGSTWKTKS